MCGQHKWKNIILFMYSFRGCNYFVIHLTFLSICKLQDFMQHELNLSELIPSLVLSPSVASIQRLPAVSVMTDINFPMKGRKGMVDWARNSEDKVVIPKGIFLPQSTGNTTMMMMVMNMNMVVVMMTRRRRKRRRGGAGAG